MIYFRYNFLKISESKYWKDQNPFTQISNNSSVSVSVSDRNSSQLGLFIGPVAGFRHKEQ